MSVRDWLLQGSPKALGTALATSVLAGLSFGAWLQLPGYLSEPIDRSMPAMIQAEDPGRAKWREVVASLGGLGATFTIPAYFYADPPPAVFERVGDREYEQAMAESERLLAEARLREDEAWYRREERERDRWERRLRQVRDFVYRFEPVETRVEDDPYGYGPPPDYGPPPEYGPPGYAARGEYRRYGPPPETATIEVEPPPWPSVSWR